MAMVVVMLYCGGHSESRDARFILKLLSEFW